MPLVRTNLNYSHTSTGSYPDSSSSTTTSTSTKQQLPFGGTLVSTERTYTQTNPSGPGFRLTTYRNEYTTTDLLSGDNRTSSTSSIATSLTSTRTRSGSGSSSGPDNNRWITVTAQRLDLDD